MSLKLFLIVHDECGENLDAIVEAETPSRAEELWCEQWERDRTAGEHAERIYEINPTGKEGILGWNTMQLRRIV